MVQVYKVKDYRYKRLLDNEIMVELPHFEALIFNLDFDYFIDVLTGDTLLDKSFLDFICNCKEYDNIINFEVTKCLRELINCSLYVANKSIDEIVNKFNSIELEEIIWQIIREDVLKDFRNLYENSKKKETLL